MITSKHCRSCLINNGGLTRRSTPLAHLRGCATSIVAVQLSAFIGLCYSTQLWRSPFDGNFLAGDGVLGAWLVCWISRPRVLWKKLDAPTSRLSPALRSHLIAPCIKPFHFTSILISTSSSILFAVHIVLHHEENSVKGE